MTSKITIYNGALRLLGERRLSGLTEVREPRRLLDDVWDEDGVKRCLQQGQWNFAIRSTQMDYDTGIAPPFGYTKVFAKPSDFVRTAGVCMDEYFECPIDRYLDNAGYWVCDYDSIFVRYVSDDDDYGMDFAKWPPNFTAFVEAWFALQIAPRLSGTQAKMVTQQDVNKLLREARATDSQEEPPKGKPLGSWSRARYGNRNRDRTPRGSLY